MFQFFANIFGYLLNFINNFVGNYGLAIIMFTILIKIIMLPLSIKQQRTMKKSSELQEKMKVLQFKYKNDPEKLNREMMDLYKKENMSPFSGCLSTIIQFILLISIFYMVRCPLTYMEKIDKTQIESYVQQLKDDGMPVNQAYSEIDIIREVDYLKEKFPEDENLEKINLNIFEIFKYLKNIYDFILIDIGTENKKEINNILIKNSDLNFLLIEGNLIGINKAKILINNLYDKNNFNLIINKKDKYCVDLKILNIIFENKNKIQIVKYNKYFSNLINKNFKNIYLNKKINLEKIYKNIINKIII